MGRIEREKRTVRKMIQLYCQKHHSPNNQFCEKCESLVQYSAQKLNRCQFGETKPVCIECPVHCYSKNKREEIKGVMRYAGPRMIFAYPYLAIMHITDKYR